MLIFIYLFFTEKIFFLRGLIFIKNFFLTSDGRGQNRHTGGVAYTPIFPRISVPFCSHYNLPPLVIQ